MLRELPTRQQTGKRGGQPVYAAIAIETALALRLLFPPAAVQTEGFLRSILTLMDVPLPCPDHTTLSRRHATVEVRKQVNRASQGPLSLIVDSSGLQVCGQGEWHAKKHGEKKVKRWKKQPISVDAQGWIIASTLTDGHAPDPSHVPVLLAHIHRGEAPSVFPCSAACDRSCLSHCCSNRRLPKDYYRRRRQKNRV